MYIKNLMNYVKYLNLLLIMYFYQLIVSHIKRNIIVLISIFSNGYIRPMKIIE